MTAPLEVSQHKIPRISGLRWQQESSIQMKYECKCIDTKQCIQVKQTLQEAIFLFFIRQALVMRYCSDNEDYHFYEQHKKSMRNN